MSFSESIEEAVADRDKWIEEYGIPWGKAGSGKIFNHDEMTQAERAEVEKLDKQKLVWTNNSTCDGDTFSPGYWVFDTGGGGCGCYVTYSFYIAEKPWSDPNKFIDASVYMPCPVCNEDGEGEDFPEDCEGPELPKTKYGVDLADGCEEGYIQVYLD